MREAALQFRAWLESERDTLFCPLSPWNCPLGRYLKQPIKISTVIWQMEFMRKVDSLGQNNWFKGAKAVQFMDEILNG